MCYKYATPKLDELIEFFNDQPTYQIRDYQHYYLADGFVHPMMGITTIEEPRVIQEGYWGLIPAWAKTVEQAKDIALKTLNAVSETVYEKPSFKNYIGKYRCLIWVQGFFEWQHRDNGKNKIPHFIYMKDQKPFSFGGIYSKWPHPETGEIITTFSILTTPANTLMSEIHNSKMRMPLIIAPEQREQWLSPMQQEDIQAMMQTFPDGGLAAHTISKLITTRGVDNNVQEVQEQFTYSLF
jgi:putative SOS response-associated peptidase YedK